MADGQVALASWILILGRADDPTALRFDGIDHFEMDEDARVVLKKGWLKGLSTLPKPAE